MLCRHNYGIDTDQQHGVDTDQCHGVDTHQPAAMHLSCLAETAVKAVSNQYACVAGHRVYNLLHSANTVL